MRCYKCSTALRAVNRGMANHGMANHGMANHEMASHEMTGHGAAGHGTECRATLGTFCFAVGLACFLVMPVNLHAQQDLIQDVEVLGLQPGFAAQPFNAKPQLLKQMRGLIQNELSIVSELCDLDQKQQQTLVDLAESEWKAKTNTSIIKRVQEQVYGTVDLDGLAERVVRSWVGAVVHADQLDKYDKEIADRMKWRQKAVVSKILDMLEAKLKLSGLQMVQIEEVLNEKWKDRFYHSLEATFDNASLLPDIRPSWISPLLSDSQRAALVTRDSQTRFGTAPMLRDSPSLSVDSRFVMGNTTSSDSIEIEPVSKKAIEKDGAKVIEDIIKRANTEEEGGVLDAKKP